MISIMSRKKLSLCTFSFKISRAWLIYLSKELYEESEKEKERFSLSMKAYERGADPKYKTNITAETFHTWDEVLEEVDRAVSRHKDGKNSWSAIRQGLRKFGSNHSAFNAWTGLFPTQSEYCSIICGGLKLILGVGPIARDGASTAYY